MSAPKTAQLPTSQGTMAQVSGLFRLSRTGSTFVVEVYLSCSPCISFPATEWCELTPVYDTIEMGDIASGLNPGGLIGHGVATPLLNMLAAVYPNPDTHQSVAYAASVAAAN